MAEERTNIMEEIKPDVKNAFNLDDYIFFYKGRIDEKHTENEADFFIDKLGLNEKSKILDLDNSEGFLEIGKNDAKDKNVKVEYVTGDMRELPYCNNFSTILMIFTAFGYFSDSENIKVMQNVNKALKKNLGENMMIDRMSFDTKTGIFQNRRIIIRNGKRRGASYAVRINNYNEIEELLFQAGMEIVEVYGG